VTVSLEPGLVMATRTVAAQVPEDDAVGQTCH